MNILFVGMNAVLCIVMTAWVVLSIRELRRDREREDAEYLHRRDLAERDHASMQRVYSLAADAIRDARSKHDEGEEWKAGQDD